MRVILLSILLLLSTTLFADSFVQVVKLEGTATVNEGHLYEGAWIELDTTVITHNDSYMALKVQGDLVFLAPNTIVVFTLKNNSLILEVISGDVRVLEITQTKVNPNTVSISELKGSEFSVRLTNDK